MKSKNTKGVSGNPSKAKSVDSVSTGYWIHLTDPTDMNESYEFPMDSVWHAYWDTKDTDISDICCEAVIQYIGDALTGAGHYVGHGNWSGRRWTDTTSGRSGCVVSTTSNMPNWVVDHLSNMAINNKKAFNGNAGGVRNHSTMFMLQRQQDDGQSMAVLKSFTISGSLNVQ